MHCILVTRKWMNEAAESSRVSLVCRLSQHQLFKVQLQFALMQNIVVWLERCLRGGAWDHMGLTAEELESVLWIISTGCKGVNGFQKEFFLNWTQYCSCLNITRAISFSLTPTIMLAFAVVRRRKYILIRQQIMRMDEHNGYCFLKEDAHRHRLHHPSTVHEM